MYALLAEVTTDCVTDHVFTWSEVVLGSVTIFALCFIAWLFLRD